MAKQSTEAERFDDKGCLLNADRISPGTADEKNADTKSGWLKKGNKKDADEEQIGKKEQNGAIYEIMKFKCEKN